MIWSVPLCDFRKTLAWGHRVLPPSLILLLLDFLSPVGMLSHRQSHPRPVRQRALRQRRLKNQTTRLPIFICLILLLLGFCHCSNKVLLTILPKIHQVASDFYCFWLFLVDMIRQYVLVDAMRPKLQSRSLSSRESKVRREGPQLPKWSWGFRGSFCHFLVEKTLECIYLYSQGVTPLFDTYILF